MINLIINFWYVFVISAIIIMPFAIEMPRQCKKSRIKWDNGIDRKLQKDLQQHYPFDPSKGIIYIYIYISRRVVGFWEDEQTIHKLHNQDSNKTVLNNLAKRYNLILYIPHKDQNKVKVYNLTESKNFIIKNDFPICYITQSMPPRSKVKPYYCGDVNQWFIEYEKGDEVSRWEGYM